jgi:TonB-dependent SusC/RagA subfamily outer membrane receptor
MDTRNCGRARTPPALSGVLWVGVIFCLLGGCAGTAAGSGSGQTRSDAGVLTADDIDRYYASTQSMQELLVRHFPGLMGGRNSTPGRESVQSAGMGIPLFVLNGVPLSDPGAALGLSPRDIQRVEVHRFGSATAAYGLRGANGVILITTR